MQAYKIYYKQHYKLQMFRCWIIVVASSEEEAVAQAQREFIDKVMGYAYYTHHKKLCDIKPGKATSIEYDFIPLK